ncbi:hypothetical protein [Mycobacterium scrofulaceum]|uniref:DUF7937 domain-containing protein n=1 Tax=Mycobacterium scrofulaceum TaxID=1783 RepID=A0A1A2VE45_MYCSC|nr:hypothetical protein [Mycobacterium scrofulaceum]OBH98956.1 hypothetical protein A5679_19920 [Mycobacterium scrofulaceum]
MVSQSSDDAPTGPIRGQAQETTRIVRPAPSAPAAPPDPTRRRHLVSDLTAVALLAIALLLPWNLYFGVGIPGSKPILFAVLLAVTVLSLAAVAVAGSWRTSGARFNPATAGRLRLALNIPYVLLVLAFVGFDVFETVRFGGTVTVPGGVGPGAWVGIAGCLLSAQALSVGARSGPVPEGDEHTGWLRSARFIGYASMVLAVLSFGVNLYWRVRYALQSPAGAAEFGKQNVAVIVTAVVYGVVALVAVLVAARWLLRSTRSARLATVALGASTLVAGTLVWILPLGRDIDAFHGIAQNTSTAGVGFEGYLAWAAAAAVFAPRTLFGHRNTTGAEESAWRVAARNGLLLIAVWALGSMVMRMTDLFVSVSLNYPFSRYDSVVLAGFDLATALLAVWLRINLADAARSPRLISSLCGLVATLSVARVVVGVVLAPRFADSPTSPAQHPVYGNNLAQQITSTFDVALCGLALCILGAAIVTGQLRGRRLRRRRAVRKAAAPAGGAPAGPRPRVPVGRATAPSAAATTRISTGPRIFRGDDSATRQIPLQKPKIYRPPQG